MAIPNATKLAACQAAAGIGKYLAVFTDDAGTTGANEASGGSYTRVLATETDGTATATLGPVSVPVPAGIYKEAGAFSAGTAGTFAGSGPFTDGDVEVSGANAKIDVTLIWS